MDPQTLKKIIEAAMLAAGKPLTLERMVTLFPEDQQPHRDAVRAALEAIATDCETRGIELRELASGFRFQVKQDMAPWVARLWEERAPRYSRAILETLALIAYRQPITRAEIEDIRGVAVSTHIVKTLMDREWVRIVGHRDVPGRPALYGTTREFLDYFNLKSLEEMPSLSELRNITDIDFKLDLQEPAEAIAANGQLASQDIELSTTDIEPSANESAH